MEVSASMPTQPHCSAQVLRLPSRLPSLAPGPTLVCESPLLLMHAFTPSFQSSIEEPACVALDCKRDDARHGTGTRLHSATKEQAIHTQQGQECTKDASTLRHKGTSDRAAVSLH